MKTKETKYNEAVERNLFNTRFSNQVRGKSINSAKHHLGIRISDTRYDVQVFNLVLS